MSVLFQMQNNCVYKIINNMNRVHMELFIEP